MPRIQSTVTPDSYKDKMTDKQFNTWSSNIRKTIIQEFHPKIKQLSKTRKPC